MNSADRDARELVAFYRDAGVDARYRRDADRPVRR